jgi:hypothetical protein
MMHTLGRVTSELQARELSTIWWRNIRVSVEERMERMMMMRKGKQRVERRSN